jgi:hypothetical protein
VNDGNALYYLSRAVGESQVHDAVKLVEILRTKDVNLAAKS